MIYMATAVTNSTMAALNTAYELKYVAATADTDGPDAGCAEEFTFTPSTARGLLIVDAVGPTPATAAKDITVAFSAGTLWASKAISAIATKAKATVIEVDTGAVKGSAGLVTVTLTPGVGDKLKSDHLCKVAFVEII